MSYNKALREVLKYKTVKLGKITKLPSSTAVNPSQYGTFWTPHPLLGTFPKLDCFFVVDGFPNKKNMEEFVLEIIPSTIIYVNLSKKMFCIWFWGKFF